jgi:hypothetical protein
MFEERLKMRENREIRQIREKESAVCFRVFRVFRGSIPLLVLAFGLKPLALFADPPSAAPSPTPAEMGAWMNIAILVINCGCAVVLVFAARSTAKREVTFGFVPASKEEFNRHVLEQAETLRALSGELAALRQEMRNDRDQLLLAAENRVSKLHERINTILEAVSELRGRVSTH